MAQSEIARLARRFRALRSESFGKTVARGLDKLLVYAYTPIARQRATGRTFRFLGESYPYFIHSYNATWRNERAVEIALALRFCDTQASGRLLELGNVMAYYLDRPHDVVDKYEDSPGIANVDILDFAPRERYDAFLSISTVEHIGWDETPREPQKTLAALARIPSFLTPESRDRVLVSFPLGYNDVLDDALRSGRLRFPRQGALRRVSAAGDWEECSLDDALSRRYGARYPAANAVLAGFGSPIVLTD